MITPYLRDLSENPWTGYGTCYSPSANIGNLAGIRRALGYIQSLSYNCIWLTPVMDSQAGTPYLDGAPNLKLDATGYYFQNPFAVDPYFGTMEEYQDLIGEAHSLGLYVLFDIALGHNKGNVFASPSGLTLPDQLDFENPSVVHYFMEVLRFWMQQTDLDGFRFDQAYQVPLSTWNIFIPFLQEEFQKKKQQGKKWGTAGFLIGEILCTGNLSFEKGLGYCYSNTGTSLSQLEENMLYMLQSLPIVFHFSLFFRVRQCLAQVDLNNQVTTFTSTAFIQEGFEWMQRNSLRFSQFVMVFNNHDFPRFGNLLLRSRVVPNSNHPDYWLRHKLFFSFVTSYSGMIQNFYLDEVGQKTSGFVTALSVSQRCLDLNLCDDESGRTPGRIEGFTSQEISLQSYVTSLFQLRDQYPKLFLQGLTSIVQANNLLIMKKTHVKSRNNLYYLLNVSSYPEKINLPASTITNWTTLSFAASTDTFYGRLNKSGTLVDSQLLIS